MKQLNWYQIFGKSNIPDGRTVLPTDDIQIWLHCANIWDKSYTTLAEVLADTDTLLALISSNNAVDYMVRSTTWATQITVPTMTSATTPEGEVITSGTDGSFYPYYAFDGNNSTFWVSSDTSGTSGHVGYKFISPVMVCEFKADISQRAPSAGTFKIQGSNDNATWVDLDTGSYTVSTASSFVSKSGKFSNNAEYTYYRIVRTSGSSRFMVNNLQFYSASITADATAMTYIGQNNYCANTLLADATWCEAICNSEYFESVLNVKVPNMTSATTPSGVCSASSVYTSEYPAWKAFNGDWNNGIWASSNGSGSEWIQYEFTQNMTAKYVVFHVPSVGSGRFIKEYEIAGSVDGITFTTLSGDTLPNDTSGVITPFKVYIPTNVNQYRYMRFVAKSSYYSAGGGTRKALNELQFYGRKDV